MPGPGKRAWLNHDEPAAPQKGGWLPAIFAAIAAALAAESDRWFVWLPVLFAGGILAYFALVAEPDPTLAVALLLAAIGLALAVKEAALGIAIGGAALALALGFATAKLHTELARAPVLTKEMHNVAVTGWLEAVEGQAEGRMRLTLRVIALGDLKPDATPYRVRVTRSAKHTMAAKTGDAINLKVTLMPVPEPVEPGAFDFGRNAWFARLGAVGYATDEPKLVQDAPKPPFDLAFWASIDRLRGLINSRIRSVLPGETGEIAAALITGERGGISKDLNQAMRDSGLAHILSISGLHMV